ncbi:MAG TPA: ROK family protein [Rhodanobacteraceae bacterium]|nr:ROK family protein [Rhodanobacteraceae bacterium]
MEPLIVTNEQAIGAVDIGGTKIAAGIVDANGCLLAYRETPTAAHEGFGAAMDRVHAMLNDAIRSADVELCGIGIGCTGPVDPVSGAIGAVEFLPGWKSCNPVGCLAEMFKLQVAMENDADAAALAEAEWGAGRNRRSVICVMVGTGIGAGIVLDGSLYRGAAGSHPEIGHHVIDCSGPKCFCGANGCWEVLARGPAMEDRMRNRMPAGGPAENPLTAKKICELARVGDPVAKREIEREGHYLGIGVANLVTLFAPEVIVLGGNVMLSADLFMPTIQATVQQNCGLVDSKATTITSTSLGSGAPLIGAAAVWRRRFEGARAS